MGWTVTHFCKTEYIRHDGMSYIYKKRLLLESWVSSLSLYLCVCVSPPLLCENPSAIQQAVRSRWQGSHPLCHRDTQVADGAAHVVRNWNLSIVDEFAWEWILSYWNLEMTAAPADFTCNLMRDLESKLPNQATPGFLTHKNCELIKVCCFKPLSLCDFLHSKK